MSEYNPDSWVIIKVTGIEEKPFYKVLAGWSGGYLDGDSWRMNSGIDKVEQDENYYSFIGASGSVYKCHKEGERLGMLTSSIYTQLKAKHGDQLELVPVEDIWATPPREDDD